MLQRIRVLLALLMVITFVCFIVAVLRLPQWYIDSNAIKEANPAVVEIKGNNITPTERIRQIVKTTPLPATQIYRLNTKQLEDNISKLQPVKNVFVKRYWFPARLVITLEERVPIFFLAPNLETEPNSALTTDGVLIDHSYLPFSTPVKTRKVLTYGVKDGHDEIWDKKKVERLIDITKAFEAYSRLEIKYIDLRNEKDVYIMLGDFLIRFGEINDTALARIKWIAPIIPEANKNKENIKYIDLRWEDSRYFCLKGSESTEKQIEKINVTEEETEEKPIINNNKKTTVKIETKPQIPVEEPEDIQEDVIETPPTPMN